MKKDIARKILELTLPFFNSWEELLDQASVEHTSNFIRRPKMVFTDKDDEHLTYQDFLRMAKDGWFETYAADAYAFMKQVYGDAFKPETYLKKNGDFKQSGADPYIWVQYCTHVAMALYMKYEGKI